MNKKTQLNFKNLSKDNQFILITSLLSFMMGLLYLYKGFKEGISTRTWIVIGLNLSYIPCAFIFKKKCFSYFYLLYSVVLIFITAFHKTLLYNNFTCLFMLFIVIMVQPKIKFQALGIYFIAVTIAYILNEEQFYHYLLHVTRGVWFFYTFNTVIGSTYKRSKLSLHDDEIKILTQLSKNRLQKSIEFEGYSESTIYRRLKAAMNRNFLTKKELIEQFKKEYADLLK